LVLSEAIPGEVLFVVVLFVVGHVVRDFSALQVGQTVQVDYLGGNGIFQAEHRKALGVYDTTERHLAVVLV
jgi:hypothetical protein